MTTLGEMPRKDPTCSVCGVGFTSQEPIAWTVGRERIHESCIELARVAAESARRAAEEARAAAEDARAAAVEQRALMDEVRATMAAYEQALKREAPAREPRPRDGAR